MGDAVEGEGGDAEEEFEDEEGINCSGCASGEGWHEEWKELSCRPFSQFTTEVWDV